MVLTEPHPVHRLKPDSLLGGVWAGAAAGAAQGNGTGLRGAGARRDNQPLREALAGRFCPEGRPRPPAMRWNLI